MNFVNDKTFCSCPSPQIDLKLGICLRCKKKIYLNYTQKSEKELGGER
jgi:hypothetical protein